MPMGQMFSLARERAAGSVDAPALETPPPGAAQPDTPDAGRREPDEPLAGERPADERATDGPPESAAPLEPFEWRVGEGEASFILLGDRPTAGWNMIELGVSHDLRAAAACITFDMGRGFERRHSIFLVIRRGKVSKRVCFVPYGTRRIRLEPLVGQQGQFRIDHFNFVWLTPRFAYARMINRIGYADKRFDDVNEKAIVRALKQEGKEEGISWKKLLGAYYEATFIHCAPETSYEYWQEHIEMLREPSANKVARQQSQFFDPAEIAVVLVDDGTAAASGESEAHRALLDSVRSITEQRYPHWQLFLPESLVSVPDDGEAGERGLAARLAAREERLRRVASPREAIALAGQPGEGLCDYAVFLRVGDRLAPNALFHLANHCQISPDAALIYGDEDVLDESGERTRPNFKPSWNPDFLLSTNYIGHASAFSLDVLESNLAMLERAPFDLHRLLLAVTHGVDAARLHHVPFVIYHNARDNLNGGAGCRPEALVAHLQRLDPGATVAPVAAQEASAATGYRVTWPVPTPAPLVSLLIPTRDRVEILKPCVDTLLAVTDYPNYEVIIIDNGSTCADTLAYMDTIVRDARVRVLSFDAPFNYSAINNFGARHAKGSVIGLVNNDIEPINPTWLSEMVAHACRPEIGCVGAKLYYPNDTVQHGGVILGLGGVAGHAHRFFPRTHPGYQNRLCLVQNLSAVTAACLLVRREIFDEVEGLNERELTVAYNDVDFCLKVRERGYRNLWTPFAELYHHESISRGADDNPVKQARAKREVDYMRRQWRDALQQDPAYNPNLTLSYEDFSLR